MEQALQNEAGVRSSFGDSITTMPSIRSLSGFALSALGAAQNVLGYGMSSPVVRADAFAEAASASCSTNGQLSCHNSSAVADLWYVFFSWLCDEEGVDVCADLSW